MRVNKENRMTLHCNLKSISIQSLSKHIRGWTEVFLGERKNISIINFSLYGRGTSQKIINPYSGLGVKFERLSMLSS